MAGGNWQLARYAHRSGLMRCTKGCPRVSRPYALDAASPSVHVGHGVQDTQRRNRRPLRALMRGNYPWSARRGCVRSENGRHTQVRRWAIPAVAALACATLLVVARLAHADAPDPDNLSVSVVTFGRGDAIHQYFGHNAIVIEGDAVPEPTVFNYGMFNFGPDMLPQFLQGRLRFWLGLTELERTVQQYAAANRDVRLLELNLTPSQRSVVLSKLLRDSRPENREYLYDHYFDNCSTRVRDVLDTALRGQLRRAWSKRGPFTLRQETMRHTQHDPLTEWSMMFALNGSVDRPQTLWADAFLPLQLDTLLQYTTYLDENAERVPLVKNVRILHRAERPALPAEPEQRWPLALGVGSIIGLSLMLLGERARRKRRPWQTLLTFLTAAYGCIGGLFGTLLTYLAVFSDHTVTHGNANLLLLNPLTLLAGLLGVVELLTRAQSKLAHVVQRSADAVWFVACASSVTLLVLKIAPVGFEQDVSMTMGLLLPINVGIALARSRLPDQQHAMRPAWASQRT